MQAWLSDEIALNPPSSPFKQTRAVEEDVPSDAAEDSDDDSYDSLEDVYTPVTVLILKRSVQAVQRACGNGNL